MTAAHLPAGALLPLARRVTGAPDPLRLYGRLSAGGSRPHTLLLESADATTGAGERSLLLVRSALRARCLGRRVVVEALSPNGRALLPWLRETLAPMAEGTQDGHRLTLHFPEPVGLVVDEAARSRAPSPLDVLRALQRRLTITARPADVNHLLAGVFSYDLVDLFEPLPPPASGADDFPRFDFWMPDQVIVIDHLRNAATVLALVAGGEGAEARYHDAAAGVAALVGAVDGGDCGDSEDSEDSGDGGDSGDSGDSGDRGDSEDGGDRGDSGDGGDSGRRVAVDLDDAAYAAVVGQMKPHIHAGEVFQIVPSRRFSVPCADPLPAYGRLRAANPSPYMFYLRAPEYTLFGASPETSVKVSGTPKQMLIRPIAGTVRRGRRADGSFDPDLDARLEAALRTDTKEVAEHLMLVDLARNDVARVSRPGTRRLARLLAVERYSHVMHLVSEVTGELQDDLDALHAYAASMNMGTLVGAPKVRAAQILREIEPAARGPYGGAVGYLTDAGDLDSAIVIRSALVRDGIATVQAGAGIVLDSDPASEARETRDKAMAVLRAITGGEVA
jgi:anthranilate synthase component 1